MKKNANTKFVYSTNSDLKPLEKSASAMTTLPPEKQNLRVWLDKKSRKGKVVTIVKGFVGQEEDLKELGRLLKIKCGVGGSQKNGQIIVQGDFRNKIVEILTGHGYKAKPAGG